MIAVYWDMSPCILVDVCSRFGIIFCLYLQGKREMTVLLAPERGDIVFLWNVDPFTWRHIPEGRAVFQNL